MITKLDINKIQDGDTPQVQSRQQSDPELAKRFNSMMYSNKKSDDNVAKGSKIPIEVLAALEQPNGYAQLNNAEVITHGGTMTYRLLNGPMTGLTIVATRLTEAVCIELKPNNKKQRDSLKRVLPKLQNALQKDYPVILQIESSDD